jgi:predicted nucleic acid-binding protein
MRAVFNTSPLCFLVLIGEIDRLPQLFAEIATPREVLVELRHNKAPAGVREWALAPPTWLRIAEVQPNRGVLPSLDPGERAAIALELASGADVVVLDDRKARIEARILGLEVTGLLGILGRMAEQGLVDIESAIDRLRATHFSLIRLCFVRFSQDECCRSFRASIDKRSRAEAQELSTLGHIEFALLNRHQERSNTSAKAAFGESRPPRKNRSGSGRPRAL